MSKDGEGILRLGIALLTFALVAACASSPRVPQAVRSELAPTGTLRAGINLGNVFLATKDLASGEVRGVAVDLARDLGERIGVPVALLTYSGPPPRSVGDVDREGVRVAVAAKTAFDLFLSRSLQRAQLVRAPGTAGAFQRFSADRLDALAGLRPTLAGYTEKLPGSRLLDGRFTAIQQAIGIPSNRTAGAAYLRVFVGEAIATGLVSRAVETHGVSGLSVAPAGRFGC